MKTINRIFQYIDLKDIKRTPFETKIGVSSGYLKKMLDRNADIGEGVLLSIADYCPEISLKWLITGKGEMLNTDEPQVSHKKGAPYYNVDFIGGFDLICNDQTINPDYYIDFTPYNKDGVVWCNLTGCSMEPELNNGDIIAMKEVKTPVTYLPFGEIYAIVTDDYRTIKRLSKSDKEGFIKLIPTNKNPEYCDQEIPISMIKRVYAVMGSIRKFF